MALDPINKLRQEAAAAVPTGHYRLTGTDRLRADDLVWSWTTKEWLRADSPEWTVATPFGDACEHLICAARKIELTEFERRVPVQRSHPILF